MAMNLAHPKLPFGIVENVALVQVLQADVDMTALSGILGRPFGHKGRHQIVTLSQDFGERFK